MEKRQSHTFGALPHHVDENLRLATINMYDRAAIGGWCENQSGSVPWCVGHGI